MDPWTQNQKNINRNVCRPYKIGCGAVSDHMLSYIHILTKTKDHHPKKNIKIFEKKNIKSEWKSQQKIVFINIKITSAVGETFLQHF